MSKFRNWVFTDFSLATNYKECLKNITYIIYGKEICPTTKNLHHQGYFEMNTQMSMKAIKKKLKNTEIHLEVARGNYEENKKYCGKELIIEEWGTPKNQGKRTDLEIVREGIKKGKSNNEIYEEVRSIQSIKYIDTARQLSIPPRKEKPTVYWFYGETGTGKTKEAYEIFENKCDSINYENGFITGYYGNNNCLWDDFRGEIPLYKLLKMLDRYPCIINVKGGSCNFNSKVIIITSCKHPIECYKNCDENIQQLIRRIDKIKNFTQKSPGNTKQAITIEAKNEEFIID